MGENRRMIVQLTFKAPVKEKIIKEKLNDFFADILGIKITYLKFIEEK